MFTNALAIYLQFALLFCLSVGLALLTSPFISQPCDMVPRCSKCMTLSTLRFFAVMNFGTSHFVCRNHWMKMYRVAMFKQNWGTGLLGDVEGRVGCDYLKTVWGRQVLHEQVVTRGVCRICSISGLVDLRCFQRVQHHHQAFFIAWFANIAELPLSL